MTIDPAADNSTRAEHDQPPDLSLAARARQAITLLRGQLGRTILLALSFDLLRFLILAPAGSGVLRIFLERWGRCSVGNFEIVAFLLSPPGVAAVLALSTLLALTFYVELAGLALLLGHHASLWTVFVLLYRRAVPLIILGVRQVWMLLGLAVPFLAASGGTLWFVWSPYDLNGLVILRPPAFWIGGLIAGLWLAVYGLLAGRLLLHWLLALPLTLFHPELDSREALRLSWSRSQHRLRSLGSLLLAWFLGNALLHFGLLGGLRLASLWILARVGVSLTVVLPVTALVLGVYGLLASFSSIFTLATFAAMLLAFYREAVERSLPAEEHVGPGSRWLRLSRPWLIGGGLAVWLGAAGAVSYALLSGVGLQEGLEITAHRGGAALAPENSVAAVRQAMTAGADWAEIDVQLTADGQLVILHDSDLLRIGGLRKRVAESTLEEIQALDLGNRLDRRFPGERVPTLAEILDAAGHRIGWNIELKPHGPEDIEPLVDGTLEAVRRAGVLRRVRICSQSYPALQRVRQRQPEIPVGFIAGASVGNLSRLDVDFLMVAQRAATRQLVDAAALRGMEVHAWTVNDPDALLPLLDRGVANVITDNPLALRRRLQEVQQLSLPERLLLRARNHLADVK